MNLWNFWICLDCWKRYECKLDKTIEFVTMWICLDCWKRYECKLDKTIEFVTMWIYGTVEWD